MIWVTHETQIHETQIQLWLSQPKPPISSSPLRLPLECENSNNSRVCILLTPHGGWQQTLSCISPIPLLTCPFSPDGFPSRIPIRGSLWCSCPVLGDLEELVAGHRFEPTLVLQIFTWGTWRGESSRPVEERARCGSGGRCKDKLQEGSIGWRDRCFFSFYFLRGQIKKHDDTRMRVFQKQTCELGASCNRDLKCFHSGIRHGALMDMSANCSLAY